MVSERVQRQIDRLLDEAEAAIATGDWSTVGDHARNVLLLDPENSDALSYLSASERATDSGGGASSTQAQDLAEQAGTVSADSRPPLASAPEAERRQLTVMFCDLQGSTALSQQLDPEDLRDVIRSYQEVCAGAMGRFEGHIAKYMGDGLMVYFGYPQAHEDDPQRAVRAGLAILDDMEALNTRLKADKDLELTVRIGIHTGLVVAGEMGGGDTIEELAIVGETPNIAARIEGAALPNSVVVSNITANLIQGFFLYEALGPHDLKGISEPVELFRVLEESGAETRFEVATATRLTALVGREQEVGLLLDRWEQVEEGLGQVVLISGEAGIGKSRLIDALGERLAEKAHIRWRLRCSAYHQTSTLHPLKEVLEIRLGFGRDDSSEEKLAKLEDALATPDEAPLLASLLSLPVDGRYRPLQLSPEGQKERSKEILAGLLMETDTGQPVLLVVEDLHWADPTTLEFLTFLVDQAPTTKLLALLTFRPEFTQPWGSRAHLSQISLNRLPRRLTNDMLTALTGGKEFPEEIVTQIATKSDGVPLFVEELTRMVIESGLVLEVDGRYVLSGPLPALAIPSTLQDSLTARLDRLSSVKELVQLAAVLGREFSHELIRAISPLDDATLGQHLEQLVTGEFLYQRGVPPDASYSFKHALIQDAAYNSLLISRRQQYHNQTAIALSEHFTDTADAQPELLAHHYFEAGLTDDAVPFWLEAGERALANFAYEEAKVHYQRILSAMQKQSPDSAMAAALFGLGRAQDATVGRREPGMVFDSISRAFDIYAEMNDIAGAVDVAEFSQVMPSTKSSLELISRALQLVTPDSDEAGRLLSRYVLVTGMQGNYEGAVEAFDAAMAIAQKTGDSALEMRTLAYRSRIDFWHLQMEGAVARGLGAIELARRAEDRSSEVSARFWVGEALLDIGDSMGAERHAEAILAASESLRGHYYQATALWFNERVSIYRGDWKVAREYNQRGLLMSPSDSRLLSTRMLLEHETGNEVEGIGYFNELIEALETLSPGYSHASTALMIPAVARITGALDHLHVAESAAAAALSGEFATPLISRIAETGLALMAVLQGDVVAAREQYTNLGAATGTMVAVACDRILGLLAQAMGSSDLAARHFEDSLVFCRNARYRPELAWTLCDYADTLLERDAEGDRTMAVSLLDESLAISSELGMPPLVERVQARLETLSA